MENCIGRYKLKGKTYQCMVKWSCEGFSIKGGDKRQVSIPASVKSGVPSCHESLFPKDVI